MTARDAPRREYGSARAGLGWVVLGALAVASAMATDPAPQQWLRHQWFDVYQRLLPRARASAPATVVAIDEPSLAAYGQWPWPRTRLAEILERIAQHEPAAVGLDLIMPEPDRLSPSRIIAAAGEVDDALRARLGALPDNDRRLAEAMQGRRVVLGLAADHAGRDHSDRPLPTGPVLVRGDSFGLKHLVRFSGAVRNRPELEAAAAGHGLINSADPGAGLVRRMLLAGWVRDAVAPSLAVEMLRVAEGAPALELRAGRDGLEALRIGAFEIPSPRDGRLWLRYGRQRNDRYVSAIEVLEGRAEPGLFRHKLVLVALTGIGLLDWQDTPLGERVPGIEIHMQLLENLFDSNWLWRAEGMLWLELALFIALAAGIVQTVPRAAPRLAFAGFAGAVGLLAVGGVAAFRFGHLVDVATPVVGAGLVFAATLGRVLSVTQRQRRELARRLQEQREASARMAGELDAARRVQMGMLPEAPGELAGERRVDVRAYMQPARMVGGDLYDFFMLDDRTLFVMIGDVSDKGLPAAMFMALVKALCKSAALRRPDTLSAVLSQAESELGRENRESMFATMLVVTVDLETGRLRYCNAGHEPIFSVRLGGACRRLDECGGPPLCVMDGFPYPVDEQQLQPGEVLCLITDGVTEAASARGDLYGRPRLQSLLTAMAGADPAAVLGALRLELTGFATAAEQSDDQAVVILRWNGPGTAAA